MKTETITWRELPQDDMPDADLEVLVSIEHHGADKGWFDGVDWRLCESGGVVGEAVQAWAEMPEGIGGAADGTAGLAMYDPNIRWAKHTFEITYMQWDYSHTELVEIGGNCRGADLMPSAIATHAERLYEEMGDAAALVLTRPAEDGDGLDTLECSPDDDDLEDWLKSMCVGVRIVRHEKEARP